MTQRSTSVYREFVRSSIKEPDLKPRQLTSRQIIYLRYQCAVENKNFEEAKGLKLLIEAHDKKANVSKTRQKAEELFKK